MSSLWKVHYQLKERLESIREQQEVGDLSWIKNLPDVALALLLTLIVEEIDLEAHRAAGEKGPPAGGKSRSGSWGAACKRLTERDSLVRACSDLGIPMPPRVPLDETQATTEAKSLRPLLFEVALAHVQEFGVYVFTDPVVRLTMLDLDEQFRSLRSTQAERAEARKLLRRLFTAALPQRPIDVRSIPAAAILKSVRDIAEGIRQWNKQGLDRKQLLDCLKWEFSGIPPAIWDSVEDLLHFDAETVALEVVRRDAGYPMSADSLRQMLKPGDGSLRTPIWPGLA